MQTIRQQIISLLRTDDMTAIELSQELHIREKDVVSHLEHVARSLAAGGEKLVTRPFRCLSCGFIFKERNRFTRPGRCPRCKESHIETPRYQIR